MNNRYVKNKKSISDLALAVIVSLAGAIGIIGTVSVTNALPYTNSFLSVVIFGLAVYFMKNAIPEFRNSSKYSKIVASVFALILSVALHWGSRLETVDNVNFKDGWMYAGILLLAIFIAPSVNVLWIKYDGVLGKKQPDENKQVRLYSIWIIIFLMWIPTFMAFFPGAFVYDAADEYIEVISRNFTMHHPLFHVLMLGGIVHLAEYMGLGANAGIAVYTLIQMAVFSGALAYFVYKLQSWGVGRKILLGIIIFFGLFPLFPMYAVCSAKDTLFTAMFLLIVILLADFIKDKEKFFDKRIIAFVICSMLMMLLRNNGMYAYIVAIPVIVIISKVSGENMKLVGKLVVLMMLSVVLYKGANYCMKVALSATDSEHQEMLTVPIQQLARVYKYSPETFSDEEKQNLLEILPENYLITYTPRCSDVLKSGFNNNAYGDNSAKYKSLWFNIGRKKPYIYLNAWLVNSYGYWYPDMIINVYGGNQMYTYQYKDSSYFGFETEPPGQRKSLFPLLEELYRNISLELFQQKMPVISMLFSPGFVFWIFAWLIAGTIRKKQWMLLAVLSPVILLWGTVLLGPTVLVRYVLILWCLLPLGVVNLDRKII